MNSPHFNQNIYMNSPLLTWPIHVYEWLSFCVFKLAFVTFHTNTFLYVFKTCSLIFVGLKCEFSFNKCLRFWAAHPYKYVFQVNPPPILSNTTAIHSPECATGDLLLFLRVFRSDRTPGLQPISLFLFNTTLRNRLIAPWGLG